MDKDELKNQLTDEQIYELLINLNAEPQMTESAIICRTICHGGNSHKLYYYPNTRLFRCYTDCGETFDIFELIMKVKKTTVNEEWSLPQAMYYIATYFGIAIDYTDEEEHREALEDWKILETWEREKKKRETATNLLKAEFKDYDEAILQYMPFVSSLDWEREGITPEVMYRRGIRFYPTQEVLLIPHYAINNKLVGIRQRTLFKDEEKNGKYRPAIIQKKQYSHPLGLNLYNINNSKENIKAIEKAIVFEGEKSCLQYASFFGLDNDISVACCGSNLINQQVELLIGLGVKEIIVGFDKQFQKVGDDEWKKLTKNFYNIHNRYGGYTQISYLFDDKDLLGYKDSPTDKGKDVFLKLFQERVVI